MSARLSLEVFHITDLTVEGDVRTLDLMGLAQTIGLATIAFHALPRTSAVV